MSVDGRIVTNWWKAAVLPHPGTQVRSYWRIHRVRGTSQPSVVVLEWDRVEVVWLLFPVASLTALDAGVSWKTSKRGVVWVAGREGVREPIRRVRGDSKKRWGKKSYGQTQVSWWCWFPSRLWKRSHSALRATSCRVLSLFRKLTRCCCSRPDTSSKIELHIRQDEGT